MLSGKFPLNSYYEEHETIFSSWSPDSGEIFKIIILPRGPVATYCTVWLWSLSVLPSNSSATFYTHGSERQGRGVMLKNTLAYADARSQTAIWNEQINGCMHTFVSTRFIIYCWNIKNGFHIRGNFLVMATGDVPLDRVAFSRLDWIFQYLLEKGRNFLGLWVKNHLPKVTKDGVIIGDKIDHK